MTRVLGDVRQAVTDWAAMRQRVLGIVAELGANAAPIPADELAEGRAFLRWLADNHFTFLGSRSHELVVADGEDALRIVPGSSLGILREVHDPEAHAKVVASGFAALPPEVRAYARRPELLVITKSTARSTVHRPGYLDYVAVKRFGADGEVCGEDRFLGLFTSTAYSANPAEIPLLGTRSPTSSPVPASRGAAMPARRSSTSSRPTRVTNCSRPVPTRCCARPPASCTSASGSGFACSCGAIPSIASCPA